MPKHDITPPASDADRLHVYREALGQLVRQAGGKLTIVCEPKDGILNFITGKTNDGRMVIDLVLISKRGSR